MKIMVLLKRTPDTEAKIKLNNGTIDYSAVQFIMNPYDEFALEEALRTKENSPEAEVILCSVGKEACREVILRGLAMGADRGILVLQEQACDSLMVSKIITAVIKKENPSIVFCGKQGIDANNMHVGVMVAELLGWSHVNVVNKLTFNDNNATVEREIEGGSVEVYNTQLPVVIGANKALNTPRYVSLPGIMKAKRKPLEKTTANDLSVDCGTPKNEIVSYHYPPQKPEGKVFKDKPVQTMVAEVVKLLREEAKVV